MDNSIITYEVFLQMKQKCKAVVKDFYDWCNSNTAEYDPNYEDLDVDACAVSDERIEQLFSDLSEVLHIHPEMGRFRDNDVENGRYTEASDTVLLPYCINYETHTKIASVICHELFHAFQYAAICNPENYPSLPKGTIDKWRFEFDPANYENGDRDSKKYRDQEIEQSARDFARDVCVI